MGAKPPPLGNNYSQSKVEVFAENKQGSGPPASVAVVVTARPIGNTVRKGRALGGGFAPQGGVLSVVIVIVITVGSQL